MLLLRQLLFTQAIEYGPSERVSVTTLRTYVPLRYLPAPRSLVHTSQAQVELIIFSVKSQLFE